jgi:hypothetical protein
MVSSHRERSSQKQHFSKGSSEFCRHPLYGDEKVAADFPHGNAKTTTRNYTRTPPPVFRSIKATESGSAMEVYRLMVTAVVNDQNPTTAPRNLEQEKNTLKTKRNRG